MRERNINWLPSICCGPGIVYARTRDGTCNLTLCPYWELNFHLVMGRYSNQTEPHQPGLLLLNFYFIYLFLERGERKEKERERNINVWLPLADTLLGTWPTTQACDLTGNRTVNPSVCRPKLNPLTELHQPGLTFDFFDETEEQPGL